MYGAMDIMEGLRVTKKYVENDVTYESYGTGDIITIELDLDKSCIYFTKNNGNKKLGFDNVHKGQEYRLAVSLQCRGDCVQLLSYKNLSEKKEEEKDESQEVMYI